MLVQIYFVSYNNYADICSCLFVQLFDPLLALFEAITAGDVKNNASADGVLVVHLGQTFVAFLACCVPHFVFDHVVSNILVLSQETPTNSGFMRV
jgi:hypothetical protein